MSMNIKKKNMKPPELKKPIEFQSVMLNKNINQKTMTWKSLKIQWRYLMR